VERPDSSECGGGNKKTSSNAGKVGSVAATRKRGAAFPAATGSSPIRVSVSRLTRDGTAECDHSFRRGSVPRPGSHFSQTLDQAAIGAILGFESRSRSLYTPIRGRRLRPARLARSGRPRETAAVAKGMRGTPVKLVWTRGRRHAGGRYRPMFVHHVESGSARTELPAAWNARRRRPILHGRQRNAFEQFLGQGRVDVLTVEGTADTRYSIPNFHVSATIRP